MSLSLFARKAAVCCSLAACCSTVLAAESAYQPLGSEQAFPGVIPGDQAHPSLAIGATGGFLVWDDNATDGDGTGISAVGLSSLLEPAQAPFRVNFAAKGDQEEARVALTKDGGAVFVWRGGPFGLQQVYARFLSPEKAWLTGDIQVSAASHTVKGAPSVAVLTNGNIVVVWSTFGQRSTNSMQDVYGQIFSPAGVKVGGAFAVNQFTAYNQRTPAVAALPKGGFITLWVSEQQREPIVTGVDPMISARGNVSVDVYARLFNADANPTGAEFLVNTNSGLCANPAAVVAQDGRFLVAWSQGDLASLTNSWDVYARTFSDLAVGGKTFQVNTRLQGSQYAPQLARLNNDYLAVWTSSRQDGSGEGVYGQFLDLEGNLVGAEFRVNTGVLLSQDQPAISSDDFGRFLAVWRTAHAQNRLSIEVMAQRFGLPGLDIVATTNYAGPVFVGNDNNPGDGGNGGDPVIGGLPILDFPVAPSTGGTTLPEPFLAAKGSYQGLAYNKDGVRAADSGYVSANISSTGGYSISFRMGIKTYTFAGKLDAEGKAVRQITRAGKAPVTLNLALDLTGSDQLQGTISDGEMNADFLADRAVYSASTNPYASPGVYTVVIAPAEAQGSVPAGSGYGTIKVTKAGKIVLAAKLADGTVITQNSGVSKNGIWPLYASPYQARGRVLSWVQLSEESAEGSLVWIKPSGSTKSYPAGFSAESQLQASRYTRPAQGKRVLELPQGNAEFVLSGGGYASGVNLPVYLDLNNKVVDATGTGVKATINLLNGSFKGSFIDPATSKRVQFAGQLLQGENMGAGFFLNNNLSGQVSFVSPMP